MRRLTPVLAADLLRSARCHLRPIHKACVLPGTVAEITIYSEHSRCAQTLASAVLDEFDRLHWLLHAWKDSALSDLNRAIAAGEQDIPVKPELAGLIRDATEFSKRSRGLFNPAIGKLVRQWNFHASEFVPAAPDPRDVRRVLDADPKMTDVMLNGCTVNCANRYVQLDFGGYAKGYALDRAIRFLRRKELTGALINIGGNLMALDRKASSRGVGIRAPRNPGPIARLPSTMARRSAPPATTNAISC
jgi:thiamine biosynthesis lipoprotein